MVAEILSEPFGGEVIIFTWPFVYLSMVVVRSVPSTTRIIFSTLPLASYSKRVTFVAGSMIFIRLFNSVESYS